MPNFTNILILTEVPGQNNFEFSVICLQEITYIHQRYSFEKYNLPAKSNVWEGLINNINCYKNIYICNIYPQPM